MWSYVEKKTAPRWLWHAIDHHTGKVLAYVFGRRQDHVFLQLKGLLEPFGIRRYDTDYWGGPCTCPLRIKTVGSPVDFHRGKTAYKRGLPWPPSSPPSPVDLLDAGHVDARRHLRLSSRTASHHHGWLTPPRAAATAARETAAPRAASRRDPSGPRPWRASAAASAWPSPSRASAQAAATGGVRGHAANRN